ncbi:MAG: PDZ domain-containing protein [Wenzhouxiangella sp.]
MKVINTSLLSILAAILIAANMLADVQAGEPEANDTSELRQQLDQARLELAEVAQRLARLQRELVESEVGSHWHFRTREGDLKSLEDLKNFEFDFEFDEDRLRQLVFAANFPPRLGLVLGTPDPDAGFSVIGITPGSGADQAGLQRGDRVLTVNGQEITDQDGSRVRDLLSEKQPGDTVEVLFERDGVEQTATVTLGSATEMLVMGDRLAALEEGGERIIHFRHGEAGMSAPQLTALPGLPSRLSGLGHGAELVTNHSGLEPYFGTGEGILVLRIAEDNPLNLESGDVVLSIDGETVSRPVDLGRLLLKREAGDDITIQVMRQGMTTELYGTIPEQDVLRSGQRVGQRIGLRIDRRPSGP